MPRPSSVRTATSHVYPDTVTQQRDASLAPPQLSTSEDITKQIRASLGLPPKPEVKPTVPVEGHVCDFPIWSYSKKRSSITPLRIDYDDGSFFELDAPKGMPSPSFPGYLDVILFYGQRDLFIREYVGVLAVLEQKTTILWKCLYLLASLKDSPGLGEVYRTNSRGGDENPVHGRNTTINVDKSR